MNGVNLLIQNRQVFVRPDDLPALPRQYYRFARLPQSVRGVPGVFSWDPKHMVTHLAELQDKLIDARAHPIRERVKDVGGVLLGLVVSVAIVAGGYFLFCAAPLSGYLYLSIVGSLGLGAIAHDDLVVVAYLYFWPLVPLKVGLCKWGHLSHKESEFAKTKLYVESRLTGWKLLLQNDGGGMRDYVRRCLDENELRYVSPETAIQIEQFLQAAQLAFAQL